MEDISYVGDGSTITTHHYHEPNGKETHLYEGRTKIPGPSCFVAKLNHNKALDTLRILNTFMNENILKAQHVTTIDYTYLFYENVNHTLLCDAESLFEKSEMGSYQFSSRGKMFFWEFGEPLESLISYKLKWERKNILVRVDGDGHWHPILGDHISASENGEKDENWKKAGSLIKRLFDNSYVGKTLHPEVEDLIEKLENGKIKSEIKFKSHPALWTTLMFIHFVKNAELSVSNMPEGSCATVFATLSPSLDMQLYKKPHMGHLVNVKELLSQLRNKFEHHYRATYDESFIKEKGTSKTVLHLAFRKLDQRYAIKLLEKVADIETKGRDVWKTNPVELAARIAQVSESFPKSWYL